MQGQPVGHLGAHIGFGHLLPRGFRQHLALDVPGIGGEAQAQLAAVDLAAVGQKMRGDLGALSQQHQQHAGSHGVQGARVADLALAQALERREAAGRRGAGRLVEHQDAVQLGQRRRFACGGGSLFGHTQKIMIASLRHEVKSAGIWRQAIACCGPKVKRFVGPVARRGRRTVREGYLTLPALPDFYGDATYGRRANRMRAESSHATACRALPRARPKACTRHPH